MTWLTRGFAFVVAAMAFVAQGRDVPELEDLQREVAVTEEVLGAALKKALEGESRVVRVSSDYLAGQGALISMEVTNAWVSMRRSPDALQITTDLQSLADIPVMVREIVEQLDIAISPYSPEQLEDLRSLRDEQRDLHRERREIYSRLRSQRRALQGSATDPARIETEIAALEDALRVIEEAETVVAEDIDDQYERLRSARADLTRRTETTVSPVQLHEAVAGAVCDFGATLKSLGSDEYLTVKVIRSDLTHYHAFKMDHVRGCQRGDFDAAKLLERAYLYQR